MCVVSGGVGKYISEYQVLLAGHQSQYFEGQTQQQRVVVLFEVLCWRRLRQEQEQRGRRV